MWSACVRCVRGACMECVCVVRVCGVCGVRVCTVSSAWQCLLLAYCGTYEEFTMGCYGLAVGIRAYY